MSFSVQTIAEAVGGRAEGDVTLEVLRAAEPGNAGPDDLAMAMAPSYASALSDGQARAAMMWEGADWKGYGLQAAILVPRPRLAMSGLTRMLDPGQDMNEGIHPSAVIDPSAELEAGVSVGPLAVIGPRARIGAGSVIGPQSFVGAGVVLGADAYLREQVTIGARARIGERFMAQPGARIASDGFSFVTPEISGAEAARQTLGDQGDTKAQAWLRIHSLGSVVMGDDVEVGANVTIDSGTIRPTEIGDGTKLDNQVHIGHNCRVGRHCLICGQAGLSGSVVIGDYVVLGGQSGVSDNVFVGERAILGGATKVLTNVPAGRVMMGYPAVKMDLHTEMYKAARRLPRLFRDVVALQKAVFKSGSSD